MFDVPQELWHTFTVCWHQHEEWFDIRNLDATIEKVRKCPLRNNGTNLLCAHNDLYPEDINIFEQLIRRADLSWGKDMSEIIMHVKWVNQNLDNLVRASYIGGSFYQSNDFLPDTPLWENTRRYMTELKAILTKRKTREDMNPWEEARFNFVVSKIQRRSQEILEWVIERI